MSHTVDIDDVENVDDELDDELADELDDELDDENDINSAWSKFCNDDSLSYTTHTKKNHELPGLSAKPLTIPTLDKSIPKCSLLNISTKTKISYLNYPIDLKKVFWAIPLTKYHDPSVGIIKKQMKFNSTTPEEVTEIINEKSKYSLVDDYIISQMNSTDGRNKFKDVRKISIGICRKDIISYRCKKKSAFYNCFVVILRVFRNNNYKEIHVKVFNTGKMEIPGIQDGTILNEVLTLLVTLLTPLVNIEAGKPLEFLDSKTETVMINSNFNCGYYINREKMYNLLKHKYKINSNFDPCSYPGIQCEFYHDLILKKQNGIQPTTERNTTIKTKKLTKSSTTSSSISKISFMIFRTGSVLIVGKCSEEILYEIYDFLCTIFKNEFDEIKGIHISADAQNKASQEKEKQAKKVRKIHKKTILVSM